jgi:hypothetical protein
VRRAFIFDEFGLFDELHGGAGRSTDRDDLIVVAMDMSVGTSIAFKPLGDTRPHPEERASPVDAPALASHCDAPQHEGEGAQRILAKRSNDGCGQANPTA